MLLEQEAVAVFSEHARRAVYDAIALRRDIRHFQPGAPVEAETLTRILEAAHRAPSVGLSQPWGFVIVRDSAVRERIRASFLRCREAEAARYPEARRAHYLEHKLEGLLEAAINLCVAVDLRDQGEAILGTTVQPEAVRASACCAVQNLWLAARVEGIGVGWVSIVEPAVLRAELKLPPGVEPVAYLCVGHPVAFRERPMLEETGWRQARSLTHALHPDGHWRQDQVAVASASGGVSPAAPAATPTIPATPATITRTTEAAREAARAHTAQLTKPAGSLGRLEELAIWYAGVKGTSPLPALEDATVLIFAADHGVAVEGVSAYGSQTTAAVVANIMADGAAINAIAREARVTVMLTDVGVAGDLTSRPANPLVPLHGAKVRAGTANLRVEPAMTDREAADAREVGAMAARRAIDAGAGALGLGEVGIGNTTAAAALICALTDTDSTTVVGRGTGVGDAVLMRKRRVVDDALRRHGASAGDPASVLASLGGLEIAALVGCILEGARRRVPVVLDGVVTNAAALVAVAMEPAARDYLLASHGSPEPGAKIALERLGLVPLLDLGLRLGEGTGAALGLGLLRASVHTHLAMATFATAGIVGRAGAFRATP